MSAAEYGTFPGEGYTIRDLPKPARTRQHAPWHQPTYAVTIHRRGERCVLYGSGCGHVPMTQQGGNGAD